MPWLSYIRRYEPLIYGGLACILAAVALFLPEQAPGSLLDQDGYFHLTLAQKLWQEGLVRELPHLSRSIHADGYSNYHFLFQVFLSPFVNLASDPVAGFKVAICVFLGVSVFIFVHLLANWGVGYRWFWVLMLLAASPVLTGRLLFGRGAILMPAVLALFLILLQNRNSKGLFALSFFSLWYYPAFVVPVFLSSLCWMFASIKERRLNLNIVFSVGAGTFSAFLIHPSFPHQFYGFYVELVVQSMEAGAMARIQEWHPPSIALFWKGTLIPALLILWLGTMIILQWISFLRSDKGKAQEKQRIDLLGATPELPALILFCLVFLLASLNSLKMFNYFALGLILLSARISVFVPQLRSSFFAPYPGEGPAGILADSHTGSSARRNSGATESVQIASSARRDSGKSETRQSGLTQSLESAQTGSSMKSKTLAASPWNYACFAFLTVFSCAALFYTIPSIYSGVQEQLNHFDATDHFQAADIIASNTNPGDVVLLAWYDFPRFYYRNRNNHYINGMNPLYHLARDEEEYNRTEDFFEGRLQDPLQLIRDLNARVVVLRRKEHASLASRLNEHPKLQFAWGNATFLIFEVVNGSGE